MKEYTGQKGYAIGFEGLMEFLKALLPSKELITGAMRTAKESYPEIALHETIANTLIHQDFSNSSKGWIGEKYRSFYVTYNLQYYYLVQKNIV